MKAKGVFKCESNSLFLRPTDNRAREIATEMRALGKPALMWVHTARYPEHHRFAFAVMQKIADAIGVPVEVVLLSLKYETGRFDYVQLVDKRIVENPHSISFESMDQKEFQKFWDDVLEVLKDKWLPKMDDYLYIEIRDMIAGKVSA